MSKAITIAPVDEGELLPPETYLCISTNARFGGFPRQDVFRAELINPADPRETPTTITGPLALRFRAGHRYRIVEVEK